MPGSLDDADDALQETSREVLAFTAAEVAVMLDTSVNSALQRTRRSVADRIQGHDARPAPPDAAQRRTIARFVDAWTTPMCPPSSTC